ncbi:MAG: phenylacetate--CoA ligase family protein [Anaerolineae bacterium]|nr:phenylacetate--CoA ligase family protein [Anaerolineae bacterium]
MSGLADELYQHAPVFAQHLMVSAYGLWWKQQRFGGQFAAECNRFRSRERFSAEAWRDYTHQQLRALLLHAFTSVPYYQRAWQGLGLTKDQLLKFTIDDLVNLPTLTKATARDDPESLLVNGKPDKRHRVFYTSGSTGTPIATYWLPEEHQRSLALRETRSCGFAGVSFRLPRATFSGRIVEPRPDSQGPFYRFNWFERQVYFSAFHIRPDTAEHYVQALQRHQIQWITGYSNSIFQLASMILEHNIAAPSLKAIITTSEKVTPDMRSVIEQAFSTKVYEEYGTVEDLFYACDCAYGRKHISPDAGIVEIVDDQFRPVPSGVMGQVLATGFIRPHQPMIRYRIGDIAIMDDEPCPCGRQTPVLREVIGRLEDTVYGPDGRRMVRFHGIFVKQPHVQEGQIIQESLSCIRVRVVPKPGFGPPDEQDIVHRVQQRLTDQVSVIVECVAQIERTKAGKFRAVVCNLPPEEQQRLASTYVGSAMKL